MKRKVYDSLHYGRQNAIPSKSLAESLGFGSVRELQKEIEVERAAGAVILSDPCGGGYYLSKDPDELRRFTRTLHARAKNTIKAAESAQRALDAATGQERIAGWFDDEDSRHREKAAPGAGTSESGNDTNDIDESVNDSGILPQKESLCNDGN